MALPTAIQIRNEHHNRRHMLKLAIAFLAANALLYALGGWMLCLHIDYAAFAVLMVLVIVEVFKDVLRIPFFRVSRLFTLLIFCAVLGVVSLVYWSSVL